MSREPAAVEVAPVLLIAIAVAGHVFFGLEFTHVIYAQRREVVSHQCFDIPRPRSE